MSPLCLTLHESQPLSPLDLSFEAFMLDREAARCTLKTLTHYNYTLGTFVGWLQRHGVNSPDGITATTSEPSLSNCNDGALRIRLSTPMPEGSRLGFAGWWRWASWRTRQCEGCPCRDWNTGFSRPSLLKRSRHCWQPARARPQRTSETET
jgi:hypothetical protein